MNRTNKLFAVVSIALGVSAPAWAHHSFAMFDMKKEVILEGVVTEFQYTSPHSWVELDVTDARGRKVHWSIEGGSPPGLARQGWKRNTLKPGDKVKVRVHPLRDGKPGASMIGIQLADGRVLGAPLEGPTS